MNADQAITLAFALTNVLRLISYVPQIWCVARDRSGAQAISCFAWNLWIAANAVTAVYVWTQLHDWLLSAIHAANALCCAVVVLNTLAKRAAHARARADADAATAPPPAPTRALEIAMTPPARSRPNDITRRAGTGAAAVSIAAALVAGLLVAAQGTQSSARASTARDAAAAPPATPPQPPAAIDASVDWSRVERAPDPTGAPMAPRER